MTTFASAMSTPVANLVARSRLAGRSSLQLSRLLLLLALLVELGCGKRDYQQPTAPVSGEVKLDGQPLPAGYITVIPASGRAAKGTIQPDGSFTLSTYRDGDGAQVGTHPVTVAAPVYDELRPAHGAKVQIPKNYARAATSGLTITVEPETENHPVLELQSH